MPFARQKSQIDIRPLLRAHAEWIVHLREYVYGSGTLDVQVIMRDDQCDLGRWIYGEAAPYRHLPEYEAARQAHALFHAEAAQVVNLMEAGRRHEAALAINQGGRLRNQSAAMVRSFIRLSERLASPSPTATARPPDAADCEPARRPSPPAKTRPFSPK
ncbi:MAG: CZB domain-containing protein [Rhodospirillales bacterium]|nr:CZB domain-containing protein [Rhodospirillales bacterium]